MHPSGWSRPSDSIGGHYKQTCRIYPYSDLKTNSIGRNLVSNLQILRAKGVCWVKADHKINKDLNCEFKTQIFSGSQGYFLRGLLLLAASLILCPFPGKAAKGPSSSDSSTEASFRVNRAESNHHRKILKIHDARISTKRDLKKFLSFLRDEAMPQSRQRWQFLWSLIADLLVYWIKV